MNTNKLIAIENVLLKGYYNDLPKFIDRVKAISKATIDEFWRPEAFTDSEEYSKHMMHWKPVVEKWTAKQVCESNTFKAESYYNQDNLFNCVLKEILHNISFYEAVYHKLYYKTLDSELTCSCESCNV